MSELQPGIDPHELCVDARTSPFGMDNLRPEFTWKLVCKGNQTAFQLQVSTAKDFSGAGTWDTGRKESPDQIIRYEGPSLLSSTRYFWRVRVWVGAIESKWSAPAWFETGFLDKRLWKAAWISGESPKTEDDYHCLYLRGFMKLDAPVVRARAYVSALGWYRFFVNGSDLTGDALVPRWTPLDQIVEYQVYDITNSINFDSNVLSMAIGDGRYRGRLGAAERRSVYGRELAGFVQVVVEFENGRLETFTSDDSWSAGSGRISISDPKHGETADFREPETGSPETFAPARVVSAGSRKLVAEEVDRVQAIDRLRPKRIWRSPTGKQLVDFGQNFVGLVRLKANEPAGRTISITLSEVVGKDGELDLGYLLPPGFPTLPPQRDVFTTAEGEHWLQLWFTIHGFRYAEIIGLDADIQPNDIEGIVFSSDLTRAGWFECSDENLNQLYQNVVWGMRSNFVDTPTDCPTRERAGWTGDIQVFSPTAATICDVQAYLRRYLRNLALEQLPDGSIPPFIPSETSVFSGGVSNIVEFSSDSVGWGDASIMIPYTLYQLYGDRAVLERQYDSMRRWLERLNVLARSKSTVPVSDAAIPHEIKLLIAAKNAPTLPVRHQVPEEHENFIIESGFHWGEWLRPDEAIDDAIVRNVHRAPAAVTTAYFANSAKLLAEIAGILGYETDAKRYAQLSSRVRKAWQTAFVQRGGERIGDDRQDDYVRALSFDLLEPEDRPRAFARLVELIESAGRHLGTGFLSTPMLLPTLARFGRPDLAYALLLQDTNPSWLYQVKAGATTVWETWEGHDSEGNARLSHNHYAFGAVAGWLVSGVAGINAASPGYRQIRIEPLVGGGLTHADARLNTPFGVVRSAWRIVDDKVILDVTIPSGTSAEILLGDGRQIVAESGEHQFQWAHASPSPQHKNA